MKGIISARLWPRKSSFFWRVKSNREQIWNNKSKDVNGDEIGS